MPMSDNQDNSYEAFSVTPDGRMEDEHIHGPILDNPKADALIENEYIKRLKDRGYPKSHIESVIKTIEENKKQRA